MSYKGNYDLTSFALQGLLLTNTLSTAHYRRISPNLLEIRIVFTMTGTPGAAGFNWNPVPAGFTYNNASPHLIHGAGGFAYDSSDAYKIYGHLMVVHAGTDLVGILTPSATIKVMSWATQAIPFTFGINDVIYVTYTVPIL